MSLKVIFYKGPGKIMDKVIRWFTKSKYSHCEIMFDDMSIFSSDAWYGGVRYTQKFNILNWDVIEIPVTVQERRAIQAWCDFRVGQFYDWTGVLAFILPFVSQNDKKWFCSELCAEALSHIGKVPVKIESYNISPQDLYNLIAKNKLGV